MSIKSLLLDYMAGTPGVGVSRSHLVKCTETLREFLAAPRFDGAVLNANDPRYTRISIVMPSFNQANFIERSVLSVLNQNYPNLQFIIMDGGSTDGTLEIIRKYERYLTWRSEPDRGQSDAINKGLALADGDLIGWLNSDDIYFPGVLYRLHTLSKSLRRATLFSGSVAVIDSSDRLLRVARFVRPSIRRLLHEGFVMQSQGVFWRRDNGFVPVVCDPELHFAMDLDLWLKLLARGPAEFIPELVGGLRTYDATKTSSEPEKGRAEVAAIRQKYGVNDSTQQWRLMRGLLFLTSFLHRALFTRRHCMMVTQVGTER